MSAEYLLLTFLGDGEDFDAGGCVNFGNRILPFANSELFFAPIDGVAILTQGEDVKTVYKMGLDLGNIKHDFIPGDTIGIIPSNSKTLVEHILTRLNIDDQLADKPFKLEIRTGTTKKNPTLPKHIPLKSTIRNIFLRHVDIHTPPKKIFLKALACFATNCGEISQLELITSPKGSKEYGALINGTAKNLLGLLNSFPSCQPPIEMLLEHLPPLQPRPYSISSSPLLGAKLEITFFVLRCEDRSTGLCTGWLSKLLNKDLVPFYFRQPNHFRLHDNLDTPLIFICAGTGLAPFRGFLQQRLEKFESGWKASNDVWLFYGCRYSNRDYLYKDEIGEFLKRGVLDRVDVAFSRDGEKKVYVQHEVERNGADFVEWVVGKAARVFVCGDVKTMVKDLKITFVDCLARFGNMSPNEADDYFKMMQAGQRFVVDAWS